MSQSNRDATLFIDFSGPISSNQHYSVEQGLSPTPLSELDSDNSIVPSFSDGSLENLALPNNMAPELTR